MKNILIVKSHFDDDISVNFQHHKIIYWNPFNIIYCIDNYLMNRVKNSNSLLITSKNAVNALLYSCNYYNILIKIQNKIIYSVGYTTYNMLQKNDFTNLQPFTENIASLKNQVIFKNTLHFSGLHTTLDQNEYTDELHRIIAYNTIMKKIDIDINCKDISHILLYSRRGAQTILNSFTKSQLKHVSFICISKSVAEVVKEFNVSYSCIPSESAMIALIHKSSSI